MKSAIRTMGYARSSPALTAAAEKGLKPYTLLNVEFNDGAAPSNRNPLPLIPT